MHIGGPRVRSGKIVGVRQNVLGSADVNTSGQKSHRATRTSFVRPAFRSSSQSQKNFKVFKDYIKKGLVDILDRNGGNRRGCSVRSEDEHTLESHPHLRVG